MEEIKIINEKIKKEAEKFAIKMFKNHQLLNVMQIRKISDCLSELGAQDYANALTSLGLKHENIFDKNIFDASYASNGYNKIPITNDAKYLRRIYDRSHIVTKYDKIEIKSCYDIEEIIDKFGNFTIIKHDVNNSENIIEYVFTRIRHSKLYSYNDDTIYKCNIINNNEYNDVISFSKLNELFNFIHSILIRTKSFSTECKIYYLGNMYFTAFCNYSYNSIDQMNKLRRHILSKDLVNYKSFEFEYFDIVYYYKKYDNEWCKCFTNDYGEEIRKTFNNNEDMINDVNSLINEFDRNCDTIIEDDNGCEHVILEISL